MPRFYDRYNRGSAPYPIPAWLWIVLTVFCLVAAVPTFGFSLVLLIAIAWNRKSRPPSTPHPAVKINEDLIQKDLRKNKEKKRSDEQYFEDKIQKGKWDIDWNPLGLPRDEWMALTTEERANAYKKHFRIKDAPEGTKYGPRGGRYTEETTSDGRTYRRYF
mgnify:CR=1 FL=1